MVAGEGVAVGDGGKGLDGGLLAVGAADALVGDADGAAGGAGRKGRVKRAGELAEEVVSSEGGLFEKALELVDGHFEAEAGGGLLRREERGEIGRRDLSPPPLLLEIRF